jgi:hypothetical protein
VAGRCDCSSSPVAGAAAEGNGCLSVTGAGTVGSPFEIGLLSTCLPLIQCTSASRPAGPKVGQPIYETNSLQLRVWNGTRWAIVHPSRVDAFRAFVTTVACPAGVSTRIIDETMPDPYSSGDPYRVHASGLILGTGTAGDEWNATLRTAGSVSWEMQTAVDPKGFIAFTFPTAEREVATGDMDVTVDVVNIGAVLSGLTIDASSIQSAIWACPFAG